MTHGKNMWVTQGNTSKDLQGDLNFATNQRENKYNLHKATSLPESPSNLISKYLCKLNIVNHKGLQTAMLISGTSCKYNFIPLYTEFRLKIHRINETDISDNRKVQQRAATDHDI